MGPDGQPHVALASFRYNAEDDAIDVGGLRMSQTRKLPDARRTGRASIVIDGALPPWQPPMIEVRGTAQVLPSGGKALGERFENTIVRIWPSRVISFGIDSGDRTAKAALGERVGARLVVGADRAFVVAGVRGGPGGSIRVLPAGLACSGGGNKVLTGTWIWSRSAEGSVPSHARGALDVRLVRPGRLLARNGRPGCGKPHTRDGWR